jgi:hypothetical protein
MHRVVLGSAYWPSGQEQPYSARVMVLRQAVQTLYSLQVMHP